jgi:transcriptional regulator GlxA family with amidase domain
MQIAFLVFDRFTALDVIGPYEVLTRVPDAEVRFVAPQPGPVNTEDGAFALVARHGIEDVDGPEVVVVPGGAGKADVMSDAATLAWLSRAQETARWTTSVCTGALILGAAGILRGRRATTHWAFHDELAPYGAESAHERMVVDGNVVTAAGVSAGIDMALWLAAQLTDDTTAQAIQLAIEYDPDPPTDAGSPANASEGVRALARSLS